MLGEIEWQSLEEKKIICADSSWYLTDRERLSSCCVCLVSGAGERRGSAGVCGGICPWAIQTLQTELSSKKRTSGELRKHPEADVNTQALSEAD